MNRKLKGRVEESFSKTVLLEAQGIMGRVDGNK